MMMMMMMVLRRKKHYNIILRMDSPRLAVKSSELPSRRGKTCWTMEKTMGRRVFQTEEANYSLSSSDDDDDVTYI
jgi:hypothetical protein